MPLLIARRNLCFFASVKFLPSSLFIFREISSRVVFRVRGAPGASLFTDEEPRSAPLCGRRSILRGVRTYRTYEPMKLAESFAVRAYTNRRQPRTAVRKKDCSLMEGGWPIVNGRCWKGPRVFRANRCVVSTRPLRVNSLISARLRAVRRIANDFSISADIYVVL